MIRALTADVLDELLEELPPEGWETWRYEPEPQTRAEWERVIAREHADAAAADAELSVIARECLLGTGDR